MSRQSHDIGHQKRLRAKETAARRWHRIADPNVTALKLYRRGLVSAAAVEGGIHENYRAASAARAATQKEHRP